MVRVSPPNAGNGKHYRKFKKKLSAFYYSMKEIPNNIDKKILLSGKKKKVI
jgi:hypothetical protein